MNPKRIRPHTRRLAVCLAVALLLSGCAATNHLRDAQAAFNDGAAAENAERLAPGEAEAALTSLAAARTSYASALQSLAQLEDDGQDRLRSDGLWGTALTLKAMCQWRLGNYDAALATAHEAEANTPEQIYPRDRALLVALPGLIKTDQAYALIASHGSLADVNALLVGPTGAVQDLQQARAAVDPDHPLQAYLIQAQLAAYRNYMVAAHTLNGGATIPATDQARQAAEINLNRLNQVLNSVGADDAQRRTLVQYWAKLCALEVPA